METKTIITPRGWFWLGFAAGVLACLFTWATHDVCYVGPEQGNWLGYGSCEAMVDRVVTP